MSELSKTLRDGLGIVTAHEFLNQNLSSAQPKFVEAFRDSSRKFAFADNNKQFVDVMKKTALQLEEVLNQEPSAINPHEPPFLAVKLATPMKNLLDSMLAALSSGLQENPQKDFLISKFRTGLAVGLRMIMQVFLVIPKLLEREGTEVNKENFLAKAEASFKFIDELTKLDLTHITTVESFLFGSDLQSLSPKEFQKKMFELYHECERLGSGFLGEGVFPLLDKLEDESSFLIKATRKSPDKKGLFDPNLFEFDENGSLTMTKAAVDRYIKQANKQIGAVHQLVLELKKRFFGIDNLKGLTVTNFCPARSISVKTSDYKSSKLKQKNLIRACFDYILKYLSELPNLDTLLKGHVRDFEYMSRVLRNAT